MTDAPEARSAAKTPRLGLWLAGLTALAVIVYAGWWFAAAGLLKGEAERWIAGQEQDGFTLAHAAPVVAGFPGKITVTYADWSFTAPTTRGGGTWRTPHVEVSAEPWSPLRFTVDLSGTHTISGVWTPLDAPATVTATRAVMQPRLTTEGRIGELNVEIKELLVGGVAPSPALAGLEDGALLIARDDKADTPTWRITLALTNWHAPAIENPTGFGPNIRAMHFDADLKGALPTGTLPEALNAWREGGGTLEVRTFAFDWPPLSVAATGTFALDEKLQPVGALTATFAGFSETLSALAQDNTINRDNADAAQTVLNLLARKPEGGGPPELRISVTVQNSRLYLGPVPLTDVPQVQWPQDLKLP
ncbi:MAG: DUF2125 domain-containing protein [Rhodospirillaceae bacterium]|nr:DUF2125 domain-containing protein [Rhodospirillaceae bacterium]